MRAEVPLLLGVGGTVLRGSIDLLVEREGAPPLVVDYKTDRLGGADPAERAAHYGVQRSIYALAVAEALGVDEVEVAYVFLERPESRPSSTARPAEMAAARAGLEATIARIGRGEFPVAPPERTRLVPLPRLPGATAASAQARARSSARARSRRRACAARSSSRSSFSPSPTSSSSAAQ